MTTTARRPRRPRPKRPRGARRARASTAVDHVRFNRRIWDQESDAYDRRCAAVLGGVHAPAWGLWRTPESELRLLGDVTGRDLLELGCGAARWSVALAQRGGHPVGLDLSLAQLAKARAVVRRSRARVPLVRASAESIPFRSGSFDVVFCDWGAMTFGEPRSTVPECARVLRPGGLLVFAAASPIRTLTFDRRSDRQTRELRRSYFELHRLELGTAIEFQLPYGAWIDLFAEHGLEVLRLIESRPPLGARTAYLSGPDGRWAERWPMEAIWKLRKRSS